MRQSISLEFVKTSGKRKQAYMLAKKTQFGSLEAKCNRH
jgi:hypothetical protein